LKLPFFVSKKKELGRSFEMQNRPIFLKISSEIFLVLVFFSLVELDPVELSWKML